MNAITVQLRALGIPVVDIAGGDPATIRTAINTNIIAVIVGTGELNVNQKSRWINY